MDPKEEKSALESLEEKLYDPQGKIENVSLHHVRDRKEKELPTSWSEDMPILRAAEEEPGLSFGAKFLLGAVLLLIFALSFTAWRVLSSRNVVSEKNIDLVFDVTPYIEGGEATPLSISLANRNEVELEDAVLTLMYKQGTGAQDEQEKVQVSRELGTLFPGDLKRQDFDITLYGSEAESRDITAKLEYKVPGSNARFSKFAVTQVVLKSPPISVNIDGPKTLSVGQIGTYAIEITNNTGTTTTPSMLAVTLPTNFAIDGASPRPSGRGTIWQIAPLEAGKTEKVTISGSLSGNQGEVATVRAIIGSVGSLTEVGVVYSSSVFDIKLRTSPIIFTMRLDTESGNKDSLKYGDRATLTIDYVNQSELVLQNVEMVLKIEGQAALTRDIKTEYGYYDSTKGTIVWNQGNVQELSALTAGESGQLLVTIPIVNRGSNSPKLTLTMTGTGTSQEVNDIVATFSKTYVVQGSTSLAAQTQHKNAPFQNTGPIPPQPNVDTTYSVHLVASTQNAIQNAKVSFVLPVYVSWRNTSTDLSKVSYDSKTRTVTWNIGTLAAGKTAAIDIGVAVRPSQVHVNTSPSITSGIVFDADETDSRAHIRTTISGLTTYISGESWNVNPSVVVDR